MVMTNYTDGNVLYATELNSDFKQNYFDGEFRSTLNNGSISVGATATLISNVSARGSILMKNTGTATIFVGNSSVTITTGRAILPGQNFYWKTQDSIYGIVATGTQTLVYLEAV